MELYAQRTPSATTLFEGQGRTTQTATAFPAYKLFREADITEYVKKINSGINHCDDTRKTCPMSNSD